MEFIWSVLVKAITGLFIGFSIGMTGIGGGILVLPTLVILFGLSPTVAVGTANLYSFLTKLYATYIHWKQKTIAVRICAFFLAGAIPANIAVAYFITWYVSSLSGDPAALDALQNNLQQFIGGLILATALFIFWDLNAKRKGKPPKLSNLQDAVQRSESRQIIAAVISGIIVGALIAATSVGGGVLLIPMLIIVFGMSPVQTVGSSIFIGSVLTFMSSIVYATGSQLDWETGIIMAIGAFVGVPIGARLSKKVKDVTLQMIVCTIILMAGILMMVGNSH